MKTSILITTLITTFIVITACSPTIQIAPPKEPIEINLNVKIEHEIRIQVDKELEGLFDDDSGLF